MEVQLTTPFLFRIITHNDEKTCDELSNLLESSISKYIVSGCDSLLTSLIYHKQTGWIILLQINFVKFAMLKRDGVIKIVIDKNRGEFVDAPLIFPFQVTL